MDIGFLLRGMVLGFSIAAPVGPIGILCIQKTLTRGQRYGLAAGLGAATADALYGCVAGFGITLISDLIVSQQFWLRLGGGLFLFLLGLSTLWSRPATGPAPSDSSSGLTRVYAATLLLTLTNPTTILSFAAIFAGLGLGATGGGPASALLLVLGVFLGSAAWWLLLSGGVSLLRERFTPARMGWVNRAAGAVMALFGLAILISR